MKKILLISLIIFIFLLTGCSKEETTPEVIKSSNVNSVNNYQNNNQETEGTENCH